MNKILGIHMIVQNEEHHLPRCLNSIKPFGGECFVTDTGSTDRTPEIARDSGAAVLHTRWEDDFAHARNISLPLASTKWILCLDADEYVIQGLEELLNYLPKVHRSISRLRITIVNRISEGAEEQVVSHPVRLFRADQGYRYIGRIHEQLIRDNTVDLVKKGIVGSNNERSVKGGESMMEAFEPLAPLCLVHDGYLASTIAQGHKPRRNLKLLQQELADAPAQPFLLYNLGVTYCQLGQIEKAVEAFSESIRLIESQAPYRPTLIRDYAKVLVVLERYDEAHALLAVERKRYPSYADLHVLYGETLEQQGLEERAYKSYARAIDCHKELHQEELIEEGTPDIHYVTDIGSDSYKAYTPMARLAQKRGFLQESAHLYRLALDSMITYGPALAGLADVLQQSGETDEDIAKTLLARWKEETGQNAVTHEDFLVQVVYVLANCGAYEQALKLLNRDVDHTRLKQADHMYWMLCANRVSDALQFAEQEWSGGGNTGTPLSPEQRVDWALASWGNGVPVSDSFLANADAEEKNVWRILDCLLEGQDQRGRSSTPVEKIMHDELQAAETLTKKIVERAVKTGQLTLVKRLHQILIELSYQWIGTGMIKQWLAGTLYHQGYTMAAADILIQCMTEGELDAEGLFYLGETLYAKGYYDQALVLFQQALEREPTLRQARAGAAVCYLRLALEAIRQELTRSPSAAGLISQASALEQRLQNAEGIPWRTVFHAKERRHQLAYQTHFTMHDR